MSTATEIAPPPVTLLNVQIDGVWHKIAKGTRVIEACSQAGKFIPRYCYHPKLSSPGNCRMCLVEMGMPKMTPDRKPEIGEDGFPVIGWIPRPQISCAQDVAEGMGIRTDSPMVQECRKGVMEFLLINHPLDCPICDQAGECRLQEFSVEYGQSQSRFLEHKVKKPKNVQLGPRVTLDDERCILCSRCIRFMKEVANDDVLGFTDRGSYSTLSCHPDRTLDSNYSLNTVDLCPVGALTNTDFRFKMRVWFLKETKTIDVNCATGSNIVVSAREGIIYRITPRENNDVNQNWIPDSHRLNFKYINREDRLKAPQIVQKNVLANTTWAEAISTAAAQLKALDGKQIAIVASGRMTNEELFLARRLADTLKVEEIDILPRNGEADGLLIAADRNPNTAGAKLLQVAGEEPGARLSAIAAGIQSGTIQGLILLGENAVAAGIAESDLAKLKTLVVLDILPNASTKHASVVLPAASFAEKRGSMINGKNRLQRLNQAIASPGEAHDDWEILRDLIQALSGSNGIYTIEEVFSQMAAQVPAFQGRSLSKIGDLGAQL
ncbi:MAG TPA: molybdopterin-dependent oxidoreductase [Chthoniobacterales bacterium]|jgi:NADH-quinone oxidoreductase subunit G